MKNFIQKLIGSLVLLTSLNIFAQGEITQEMFQEVIPTGSNMTLGFNSSDFNEFAGGYIGAFYDLDGDGALEPVGYEEITVGFFALALWGDDASTPEKDGLGPGETPTFAILEPNGGVRLIQVTPQFSGYATNGLGLVTGANFNVPGCTDSNYIEFNPGATIEDGSCFTPVIVGCTYEEACNYDPQANTYVNGSCFYAEFPLDCNGDCINDSDADGICDELEIPGCQDMFFMEFNPLATHNDGSCETTWEQAYNELYVINANLNSVINNQEIVIADHEVFIADQTSVITTLQEVKIQLESELIDVSFQLDTMTNAYLTLLESPQCEEIVINFEVGWNLFGYTSSQINQDIGDIIGSFDDKIYMIKDNLGAQYWPEFNYNGIGDFIPGQGYQLKATESFSISFEASQHVRPENFSFFQQS